MCYNQQKSDMSYFLLSYKIFTYPERKKTGDSARLKFFKGVKTHAQIQQKAFSDHACYRGHFNACMFICIRN